MHEGRSCALAANSFFLPGMRGVINLRQVLKIEMRIDLRRRNAGMTSISCTARRSPLDCSTWDANEWRSTCGCTLLFSPSCSATA